MNRVLVEAIACSADDARLAARVGVDRLEVCSAMSLGGLTPSVGAFKVIRAMTDLPLMAMIRPRASGFCYSHLEFESMLIDADSLFDAGADGIVFGILDEQGEIDVPRCRELIALVDSRQIVFHRAFDATNDPLESLEVLIELGVTRLLTSGQAPTALQGAETIRKLIDRAGGRIEILAGGGVRPDTAGEIVSLTGASQLHLGPFVSRSDRSIEASEAASRAFGDTFPVADADTLGRVVQLFRG